MYDVNSNLILPKPHHPPTPKEKKKRIKKTEKFFKVRVNGIPRIPKIDKNLYMVRVKLLRLHVCFEIQHCALYFEHAIYARRFICTYYYSGDHKWRIVLYTETYENNLIGRRCCQYKNNTLSQGVEINDEIHWNSLSDYTTRMASV